MNLYPAEEFALEAWVAVEETDHKSIPSKVYQNHFAALALHIREHDNRFRLQENEFFCNRIQKNPQADTKRLKELLYNAWNTEHLIRLQTLHPDTSFQKVALHWAFPQLYYSAYLVLYAFCVAKMIHCKTHDSILRQFSSMVKSNFYPPCISFYADGEMNRFEFCHLSLPKRSKEPHHVLHELTSAEHYARQIATFLKTTRNKKAQVLKNERQAHQKTAFLNAKGQARKVLTAEQWKIITDKLGATTIFDLLYRMRIKANYQDINAFIHADTNFSLFFEYISEVLDYLNFVHEAYITRLIGVQDMESIIKNFPQENSQQFLKKRFYERILPIF